MNEINNILFEYSDYIFSILGFFLWVAVVVLFKQKRKIKELLQCMGRSRNDKDFKASIDIFLEESLYNGMLDAEGIVDPVIFEDISGMKLSNFLQKRSMVNIASEDN